MKPILYGTVFTLILPLVLIGIAFLSPLAVAESVKVEGLIKARSGETLILEAAENPGLVVVLTKNTEVGQVQGVLKVRRKEMSMAALIPGLAVKVDGTYDDKNQLVAKSISFKGDDLKRAESIQAGLHETQGQTQTNTERLAAQQQQIAGNKAAIDDAVARFGQLDDYYIFDESVVYFGNGKINVEPKYVSQLLTLAEKAKAVNGYVIEVKGYASSIGSTELNQQLSEDRANEVTKILIQQGHVPLTRMLAPGAMGENHQVGDDKTAEGQAESRRVVVRVLQNKAIAGT